MAAGTLHLLIGRQGAGKSTYAAWVAAQASTGRAWPGGTERTGWRAAMLSLEEPAERLAARLTAAGARLEAVEVLGDVTDVAADGREYCRPWRAGDLRALEAVIRETRVQLVTIDGLGYTLAGGKSSDGGYAVIGSALAKLAVVAERTGCAILGLTHPPKGASEAVTAAIGSTAWTAVPRITWVLGTDPADQTGERRAVAVAKTAWREPGHAVTFTIGSHPETEAGFVTGLETSDTPASSITSPPVTSDEERSAYDRAVDFLTNYLHDGPQKAAEVKKAGEREDLSTRTLERVAKDRFAHRREGFGPGSTVWWSIPT